jgi:putative flippase GtrA
VRLPRFVLFLAAGGVAAVANIVSRIALNTVMPYVPAIVLAYCIGMLTAFALNRAFVFTGANNPIAQQVQWFVLVNLFAVLQTLLISLLLARWLFPISGMRFHPETIAHAIGVAVPVLTSYVGHKRLSFRAPPSS